MNSGILINQNHGGNLMNEKDLVNVIQPTSIIGVDVTLGSNVSIDCLTVIGKGVTIGSNVKIGNHVVIHEGTIIENNVRIDDHTVIGKLPMKVAVSALKINDNISNCIIGSNSVIGTGVILYKGCNIGNACLVADLATIRENVFIGNSTIIGRGAAVENDCFIGNYCKIETNAYITAHSTIEDYVFIAPGVVTSNDRYAARLKGKEVIFKGITVKRGGRIGAQATVLPGIIINEDGFAAAGSIVTRDIPKEKIHCGNPAKYLRDVPEDQLIENQ